MKKFIALLLFPFLFSPDSGMGQISYMSYNIRYDNPNDHENWWSHRKSELAKMVNHYSPEVMGIQEALHNQVAYLDSALTDYDYVGVGRDDGVKSGEYAAIFYKKQQLKLLKTKTSWLSETPDIVSVGWDASMERIVTYAKFLDKRTRDTLHIFNAHFDHRGPKSRVNAAELILELIADLTQDDSKVVVMGDLNSEPNDRPIELLTQELSDAYDLSNHKVYGPFGTYNGFDDRPLDRRIDYILTKNIKVDRFSHIDDRRSNNLWLSDHLPVLINTDQPISLMRKPYLQSALGDSLSILWRTDIGKSCKVLFRKEKMTEWQEVRGITRNTNTGLIENEVTLHNLDVKTIYNYKLYTDNERLLPFDKLHFTSPASHADTSFSFFAVGDIGEPIETHGTPDQLADALEPYLDSLQFGVFLGDIIYPDGKSEIYDKNLFEHFVNVFPYIPIFTVLGNHDWHDPDENYLKEWKLPGNEHYYSFDYSNTHFIALDSKNGDLHDYDAQIEWLKNDLRKHQGTQQWIVVLLHHNGKSCTYKNDYDAVISLYPVFEQYEVDLVLNGHAHTYERLNPMDGQGGVTSAKDASTSKLFNPEGFVSITVGSGGKLRGYGSDPKPYTPDPDNCRHPGLVAASVHENAFLWLDIEGNKLSGKAISTYDHSILDKFIIVKD